jgi:hypothetical protein
MRPSTSRPLCGAFLLAVVVAVSGAAAAADAPPPAEAPTSSREPGATQAGQPKPGALPPGIEARIAFANRRDGISTWQADGDRGIWVQGPNRQWYYGKFMSTCIGLDFAENRLGFNTEPNGDFDKFSYVEVPGQFHERCQLTSLVTSNGPPTAKERKAAKAAEAAATAAAKAAPNAANP